MAANLPPEILCLIFDEVQWLDDTDAARTRVQPLQVCRHWNEALFAHVYSRIEINEAEKLVRFAETLQQCPRIKPVVRELLLIYIHCNEGYLDESCTYNRALFHESLASFAEDEEDLAKWESRLISRHSYSWLAVVLISLPNLQDLGLNWGGHGSFTETTLWAVAKIVEKGPDKKLPLQHLREMFVTREQLSPDRFPSRDEDYRSVYLKEMIPFLKLPSMRELKLSNSLKRETRRDHVGCVFNVPFTLPPGSSNLRVLRLQQSSVMDGMYDFIAACAHLEHFEYQHSCRAYSKGANGNYRCRPFRAALVTQKESLRSLRLNDVGVTKMFEMIPEDEDDSEAEGDEDYEEERRMSELDVAEAKAEAWFGSLAEFVALKELRMPVRNILDSTLGDEPSVPLCKLLPYSIETLVLTKVDIYEYMMLEGQLRRLLSVKDQQFPNLRKVMLLPFQMQVVTEGTPCRFKVTKLVERVFADVRKLYKEQGLEFDFMDNGDFQVVDADGNLLLPADDTDSATYLDLDDHHEYI